MFAIDVAQLCGITNNIITRAQVRNRAKVSKLKISESPQICLHYAPMFIHYSHKYFQYVIALTALLE